MSFVKRAVAGKNRDLLEIKGIEELINSYGDMTKKPMQNLMRRSVHAIARDVAKAARKDAPVNSEIPYVTKGGKNRVVKGRLKKAITAKRRRPVQGRYGAIFRSDMVVTRGRKAKWDAFYWFWVEYGFTNHLTGQHVEGQNFIEPHKRKARLNFESLLDAAVTKEIEKLYQKGADFK